LAVFNEIKSLSATSSDFALSEAAPFEFSQSATRGARPPPRSSMTGYHDIRFFRRECRDSPTGAAAVRQSAASPAPGAPRRRSRGRDRAARHIVVTPHCLGRTRS
jgi:hypothetical protein